MVRSMIKERIENLMNLSHICKLMVFDICGFYKCFDYTAILSERGFKIVSYKNVEAFRLEYEETIKQTDERVAVIIRSDIYVPYDIQQKFRRVNLSLQAVFPKLHSDTLLRYARDIDLVSFAYDSCYADANTPIQTEDFVHAAVFSKSTVEHYCADKTVYLRSLCDTANRYTDWIEVMKQKATIHYYAASFDIAVDISFADEAFTRFIDGGYAKLYSEIGGVAPAIITKTLRTICRDENKKTALIVMDGMSMFDFETISRHFDGIDYELYGSFAIIPTTTPISRQSLLSGKYPRELEKPFSLANEEKEFILAGQSLGYARNQIQYLRGFAPDVSPLARLVAVIVNDVDEIVHGQRQGRLGMLNDMNVLGKSGKMQELVKTLAGLGFDVYITSDHGNAPCVGVGGFRSGVELETRSTRMAALKDFADENESLAKYS